MRLVLHGDPLPEELLRPALEQELGAAIVTQPAHGATVRGTLTVRYEKSTRELIVSWDSPRERTLTRAIMARESTEEAVEDAVLLAGNLARNEADELAGPPPETTVPLPPAPQASSTPSASVLSAASPAPERLPASASLFHPLATDANRRHAISAFDVNLIYGRIGGIDGVQLGFINVVTPADGRGPGTVTGLEVALAANFVANDMRGLQVAGVLNTAGGDAEGISLAFGANAASGTVRGGQAAFVFNRAGEKVEGAQVAFANIAGDVDGVQLGFVNVARRVRGVTVGLVNIADDIDGLPIAPISVTKTGGVHAIAWSGTSGLVNAGVRFATRHTHTTFFGAYHRDFDRDFTGGGLSIGGRIHLGASLHTDLEATGTYLGAPRSSTDAQTGRTYHEQLVQPRLRLSAGYRPVKHFGVFVGASAVGQVRAELDWDRVTAALGPELFGGVEL